MDRSGPPDPALLGGDRGAVTVEAALALFSLVAVLALAVAALAGASAHLRCLDAAREAARLVARGEPDRAREVAAAVAPRDARIRIEVAGDQVQVDVTTAVVPGLPGLTLDARAVGLLEPAALLTSGGSPYPVPGPPSAPAGVPDPARVPDTAGDDTAGDDTAGDDTAGDDTAGDDTGNDSARDGPP